MKEVGILLSYVILLCILRTWSTAWYMEIVQYIKKNEMLLLCYYLSLTWNANKNLHRMIPTYLAKLNPYHTAVPGNLYSPMSILVIQSVQFSSVAHSCPTLCDPMNRTMPGLPVHHQFPELTQTHAYQVGDAIHPSHPLSSPSPPAPNPSQHQGLFQWVNSSREVVKYWSFSFSISPSSEHPGLISFRMDWLDLPSVQGTLKSLLQHHSSKASILQHSAFFVVQLSHPYMTTGKTIALTRQASVGKVISLLFNMLARLVIKYY